MTSRKLATLTELQGCTLGVVWRHQPCTAYQVRTAFQDSLTTSWRASTGSIYPLIRKLSRLNLVTQGEVQGDRRGSRLLRLTGKGERALRQWVLSEDPWLGEPVADPIRTRSYFLALLPPSQQRRSIARWQKQTRAVLAATDRNIERYETTGDFAEVWAHRGSGLQLKARLDWLDELAAEIFDDG